MKTTLNWLEGKKTYGITLIAAIYGYGVTHNLWAHSPSLDIFLGAGGVAAFRSALKSEAAKIAQALITDPIKLPTAGPTVSAATVSKTIALLILFVSLLGAMTFSPGCASSLDQQGVYGSAGNSPFGTNNNSFLFASDKALVDSKDTLTAFLRWELKNRQVLSSVAPNVTTVADTIRDNAPLWFTNAYLARAAYVAVWKSNPAGSGSASNALQASVSLLSAQALATSSLTNTVK